MTDPEMAYPPGLALHGKSWRLTKRIPDALRPHYGGKTFLRCSTGTPDKKAAAVIALRWLADTAEEFARIRETGSAAKTIVPAAEVSRLVASMVASALGADEEGRMVGGDAERHSQGLAYAELEAGTRLALGDGDLSAVAPIADDWLQAHGYSLAPDSEDYRRVLLEFAKGTSRVLQGLKSRRAGEWVDTPPVPALPVPAAPPTSGVPLLSAVVARFLSQQDNTRPMFRKLTAALSLFLEVIGDKPVAALQQIELEDFFTLLCKLPPHWATEKRKRRCTPAQLAAMEWGARLAPQTFKGTYYVALQLFLPAAQTSYRDQGFPQHLTVSRIKYSGTEKKGQEKQRALAASEVARLFHGPECAAFAADIEQAHCYWLPLLGLYTGARVNEVCQLNPQCDIREEGGIWFMELTEDSPTDGRVRKSIKTHTTRVVPVHSRLLALGFLGYVERVKAAGSVLLFPQWPPKGGKASGTAGEWFRGHIGALGLRDDTPGFCVHGFHVFRHTFLTRADELDVAKAGAVTGHAATGVSKSEGGYVGRRGLEKLQGILEQITFDIDPPKPAE